ncbi:MAG: tRNA (adenosine(37)-N6)-threonylcarbamoyltransferase complex ATPase subunit type 1 TsaE [Bacteroidota bacterium]
MTFVQDEIREIARKLLSPTISKTLAFQGPMGAGKTTLIKALLHELGAKDAGNSPSFGIVNEYQDAEGALLAYHFDFYRLEDETEALDLGLEEYLAQEDVWIFMEWPEKVASLLPPDTTLYKLEIRDAHTRKLLRTNPFL